MIDSVAKQIIRMELEEALLHYEDYKKGYTIPYKFVPYLEMLHEIDYINAYIYSKINHRDKNEHEALSCFISGKRIPEIIAAFKKRDLPIEDIRGWIYGDEDHEGFIPYLFDKFIELNRYCPFCNLNTKNTNAVASPYPTSGKVCPHKEIEWSEEDV